MRLLRRHKKYVTKEGYVQHFNPKSPDARGNGYAPLHRDIARKKINRNIGVNEVVHHKDGNKLNNRRSNLIVVSKAQHYRIHNS